MRTVHRWLVVTIVSLLIVTVQPLGALAQPDSGRQMPNAEPPSSEARSSELIVGLRPDQPGGDHSSRLTDGQQSGPSIGRLLDRVDRKPQSQRSLAGKSDLHVLSFSDPAEADDARRTLQDDPSVAFVEPNYTRELQWVPDTEEHFEDQQWWVDTVRLPDAWNVTTGDPELVVAVIDSGVSPTHPDLEDKLVPGYNAIDGSDNSVDIDGHGTRVAGIIAAHGNNQAGTAGGAMDVRIMPIRVLGDDHEILVSWIHDSIVWAVDNGADVINLSLGSDKASEAERSAVQYAVENNVIVVAAAGNSFNRINYPASYPESISVGSLDENGNRSQFSSILSNVDVAAPGELIFSPGWDKNLGDYWGDRWGNGRPVMGTSFSTAIVSGVVALQKSINPELNNEQIRDVLRSTATDTGDPGLESGVGSGQVDAEASVRTVAFWAMYDTWFPTDFPVTTGNVTRTWLWGTDPPAGHAYEEYAEAQHGVRLVYYYDKSRMEITDPLIDRDERWYITNGLLVNELISGEMQVGVDSFDAREPAQVNVAGDPDDELGPTYATFAGLLDAEPIGPGEVITQTLKRDGTVGSNDYYAQFDVWGEYLDETTNHRVADVFWTYLNSVGTVQYGDELVTDLLFDPWFYATGLPITEAYWSEVTVEGDVLDVLIQCFERRCLTYTPDNEPAWRVEMGNVGLHYHTWRYESEPESPDPAPVDPDPVDPEPVDPEPPSAEVLYESTLEDWPEATFTGGATFVQDGAYHVQATDPDEFSVAEYVPESDFEDISVEVDVRAVSETEESEACLIARADEVTNAGYLLCIDGAGQTVAYRQGMDALGNDVAVVLLERDLRDEANPANEWNRLGISVIGTALLFEVNSETIGTGTDSLLTSGAVGISVTNWAETGAEYAFRDLSVVGYTAES